MLLFKQTDRKSLPTFPFHKENRNMRQASFFPKRKFVEETGDVSNSG